MEDFHHALVECPKNVPIWSNNPATSLIASAPRVSSKGFLRWVIEHAFKEKMAIICASLWVVWLVRNRHCLENSNVDPVQTASLKYVKV